MGAPVLDFHEVEDVATACDEENLHDEVVKRHPFVKQVKVARDEHGRVERLRLERDTCSHVEHFVLCGRDGP